MADDKTTGVPGKGRAVPAGDGAPPADAAPDRHGAISRRLGNYTNYKSWADKMRQSWVDEAETAEAGRD